MARPHKETLIYKQELLEKGLYLCATCMEVRPLSCFGKDKRTVTGFRSSCKDCVNIGNRKSVNKAIKDEGVDEFRHQRRESVRRWRKNTRPKRLEHFQRQEKEANLRRLYGISIHDFNVLLADQDGRCAICCTPNPQRSWHVDHCHDSGEIRGILCNLCNVGIGAFKENQDALEMARIYLRPRGMI